MIAKMITRARIKHEKIVHEPELIPLSEIAIKTVAQNYLQYKKDLLSLDPKYRYKIYDLMDVDYDIEDLYPYIDYEPFWERACKHKYKSDDCSISGNSWKQLYVETYVKNLISNFKIEEDNDESLDNLKRVCDMIKYSVFNLERKQDKRHLHEKFRTYRGRIYSIRYEDSRLKKILYSNNRFILLFESFFARKFSR